MKIDKTKVIKERFLVSIASQADDTFSTSRRQVYQYLSLPIHRSTYSLVLLAPLIYSINDNLFHFIRAGPCASHLSARQEAPIVPLCLQVTSNATLFRFHARDFISLWGFFFLEKCDFVWLFVCWEEFRMVIRCGSQ